MLSFYLSHLPSPSLPIRSLSTLISWYPGHIHKASVSLSEYIKQTDVIIHITDARIPQSTQNTSLQNLIKGKRVILVVLRGDQASSRGNKDWQVYWRKYPQYGISSNVFFADGKTGRGVDSIKKEILKCGKTANMKRRRLGMRPRATRAAVIGYPNVGKSSLINRLLGRKLAKSRNIPGFTKTIQWIRIGGMMGSIGDESPKDSLELLDTPGIIPPRLHDQEAATALAICNDIGQAAYSASSVAAAFFDKAKEVYRLRKGYVSLSRIERRYKLPIHELSGEDALSDLADSMFEGNLDLAGEKVLADFRKGYLGPITLELPPDILDRNRKNEEEESRVENQEENFGNEDIDEEQSEESETDEQEDGMKKQLEQSRSTIATGNESADRKSNTVKEDFVERSDKGKFDGW